MRAEQAVQSTRLLLDASPFLITGTAAVAFCLPATEKRDVYRPTWRGAFLMSWRLLWPVKPIVRVLRKRRAARLLSELGLEQ